MTAYERWVTVRDADRVVVDVPVKPGQQVRVTVVVDEVARPTPEALRALMADSQRAGQAASVSDEVIAAEIEAVRRRSA